MIRLGHSFFLDPQPDGWWLFEVTGDPPTTRRFGPYTSVRHVLQQRAVKLPKPVKHEIEALDYAAGSGDGAVAEMPAVTEAPRKGEPSESPRPPRHGPGRTDHDSHSPE